MFLDEHHFRLSINQWSPHLASIAQNVSTNDLLSYAVQMDRDNGCLWLVVSCRFVDKLD